MTTSLPAPVYARPAGAGRWPLAGTLGVACRHARPGLLPPEARDRVIRAAGRIPAALTRAAYLECRLRGDSRPVDLIFRVERDGAQILAGRRPALSAAPLLAFGGAWPALAALCAAWLDGVHPAWSAVHHLWVELDLDAAASPGAPPLPSPSVFVGLDPARTAALDADALADLACAVLAPVLPVGVPAHTRSQMRGVLARRPAGSAMPFVGCMLSRTRRAVRLYLSGIGDAAVAPFLNGVGWPAEQVAETAAVLAVLNAVPRPPLGMMHVDLLDGALLPRLGVEFTLERRPQLRGTLAEAAWLDRLVELGFCAPERRAALTAWPGCEVRTLRHELWPSLLARRVNCVKLVTEPGRAPEMKAYLLASHQPWLPRRRSSAEPASPSGEAGWDARRRSSDVRPGSIG
jgi:hypothetical protein